MVLTVWRALEFVSTRQVTVVDRRIAMTICDEMEE